MGEGPQRGLIGLASDGGASDGPDVIVVGAGAAGLWCAERIARDGGPRVTLLEKTPRTGTKVLASGGSRCNVTTTLGPAAAARLFGPRGERFLRHAFGVLPPMAVRERFEGWGVGLEEAPLEKVFPRSGNARDVRDAMEGAARAAGVRVELGGAVAAVLPEGGGWTCHLADGGSAWAPRVVLCVGGQSYPGSGTTGDGYPWLEALGLEVVRPAPALVPLSSPAEWVHALTGLAWQGGEVTLEDAGGKRLARRTRPLLFTHLGVSGPGAMDVSRHVARARADTGEARAHTLRLDAFPALDREGLRAALVEASGAAGNPRIQRALGDLPTGPMPRRLFEAFATQADLDPGTPVGLLTKPGRHALIEALKGLAIPIDGTLGWDQAEVTSGGLSLRAVDPRSMAVNGHPGLFVVGELLDLDGPIGGLSFQAAWATAEVAAAALRE